MSICLIRDLSSHRIYKSILKRLVLSLFSHSSTINSRIDMECVFSFSIVVRLSSIMECKMDENLVEAYEALNLKFLVKANAYSRSTSYG